MSSKGQLSYRSVFFHLIFFFFIPYVETKSFVFRIIVESLSGVCRDHFSVFFFIFIFFIRIVLVTRATRMTPSLNYLLYIPIPHKYNIRPVFLSSQKLAYSRILKSRYFPALRGSKRAIKSAHYVHER